MSKKSTNNGRIVPKQTKYGNRVRDSRNKECSRVLVTNSVAPPPPKNNENKKNDSKE